MNVANKIFFVCLLALLWDFVTAAHIGIFASTGPYSHQMLARNLAERLVLEGGHRVTIIQILVYGFNTPYPPSKAHWDYVVFNGTCPESLAWQVKAQRFMWVKPLAFDVENFDLESVQIFDGLQHYHMVACARALRDKEFLARIEKLKLDLLAIDYIMNECAQGLAYTMMNKVKVTYFTNYPIIGSYADSMGVPSNPSYVPSTLGHEKLPMTAASRLANTISYVLLFGTRRRFYYSAYGVFKRVKKVALPSLSVLERRMVIFSTPFEILVDVPRPLIGGLHYFGCENCADSGKLGNITQTLALPPAPTKGYILVTFGTMTRGDLVALHQLIRLFGAFARFPEYTIVWQLDAPKAYYEQGVKKALNSTSLPAHVHVFPWLPLKTLISDPRVVLVISQGGISTCMEAVNAAVPMLGMAIQGDQGYNMQRLREKGVGEYLQVTKLSERTLAEKMGLMLRENERYKRAAVKLRTLLREYKSLQKTSPSVFWLSWAERHFAQNRNGLEKVAETVVRSKHPANWLIYYNMELWCLGVAMLSLVACVIS